MGVQRAGDDQRGVVVAHALDAHMPQSARAAPASPVPPHAPPAAPPAGTYVIVKDLKEAHYLCDFILNVSCYS